MAESKKKPIVVGRMKIGIILRVKEKKDNPEPEPGFYEVEVQGEDPRPEESDRKPADR